MSTKILFLAISCFCISFLSCRNKNVSEQKEQISTESTSSVLNEHLFSDTISERKRYNLKSTDPADSVWIKVLNKIKLPEQIMQDYPINIYFKYNQIVSGYEVTGRFLPENGWNVWGTLF